MPAFKPETLARSSLTDSSWLKKSGVQRKSNFQFEVLAWSNLGPIYICVTRPKVTQTKSNGISMKSTEIKADNLTKVQKLTNHKAQELQSFQIQKDQN